MRSRPTWSALPGGALAPTALPGGAWRRPRCQAAPGADRVDRTAWEFRTLDPASSTDLDQAFFIDTGGATVADADIVLHYAIADVGFFVHDGDPIDTEAWERGATVYLPDRRATLYPPALCEHAASLLPDGPRPAVVFTVRVAGDGSVRLDGVERAVVLSRAKLAYDDIDADAVPGFVELARRIVAAEDRRGAPRVEFPEQELQRTDDGWELRFEPRLESEDQNAGMSLATNLAVADTLLAAHTGLFRVMADVPDRAAAATAAHGAGVPSRMAARHAARPLPALAPAGRPAHGGVPPRRATLGRRRFVPAVRAGRATVARGDGRHVRPRHRAAPPPR